MNAPKRITRWKRCPIASRVGFIRSDFRDAILPTMICVIGLFAWCEPTEAQERPNIILVFIDDMGWGDFSCFGNEVVQTDHIDRLAKEGLRFENFYVNSPICSPSRVAITTGQYPQRWRITSYLDNRKRNEQRGIAQWLDPKAPTLARALQDAGYRTGHFGKWHMGGQRDVGDAPLITEYGFDESLTNFEGLGPRILPLKDAYDGRPPKPHALGSDRLGRGKIKWQDRSLVTASFTDSAIDFIKRAEEAEKPFYINLWPDDVHSPFFPPQARRGDGSKRELYHGVLKTMDEQLGVLFDFIKASENLSDNTIILICSDNGPELGAGSAGPLRGYKTHLYEGGIRSPLIVWGPRFIDDKAKGTADTTSVMAAFDLPPTLLALVDIEPSSVAEFDGQSLPDVLLGKERNSLQRDLYFRRPPDRDAYYGDEDLPDLAIRRGQWKLLCEYDGSEIELYDLTQDPGEEVNRLDEFPNLASELASAVVRWHESMPADRGAEFVKEKKAR